MLEHVFRPGALGVLRLANRIVMGAMHLYLETHEDGGAAMAAFYAERARGGAGLVVTGGCAVSSKGSGGRLYARIDDPGRYHAMAAWAAAVHREGGRIALQRDRRPIYPIVGASPEEDTDDHLDDTGAGDGGTVPQVTVTQDRLGKTAGGRRPHHCSSVVAACRRSAIMIESCSGSSAAPSGGWLRRGSPDPSRVVHLDAVRVRSERCPLSGG